MFFACGNVNAEICIGERCTDATNVGPVTVTGSGNSWNCSGPGCSHFEQNTSQVIPRHRTIVDGVPDSTLGLMMNTRRRQRNHQGFVFSKGNRRLERLRMCDFPSPQEGQVYYYTVQAGDTLSGIAQLTNCSLNRLILLNEAMDPTFSKDNLRVGQRVALTWYLKF